jgi:hypothetical protein
MKNTAIDVTDIPFIDVTKYRKFKEEKKIECCWGLDELHRGPTGVELMFFGALEVPICERHYTWHCAIVTLVKDAGMDLDEVLNMSREVCMAELMKRGLIPLKA